MNFSKYEDPWGDESPKRRGGNTMRQKNGYTLSSLLGEIESKFPGFFNFSGGPNLKVISFLSIFIVVIWLLSGFYIINPEENGVELIFGKYSTTSTPGLRYNFPYPIGSVKKVKVASINREDIGFIVNKKGEGEGIILTGDENIVNVNFEVQWRVKDAYEFLYKVRNDTYGISVKSAAESAMRDSIGQNEIAFILRGEGRGQIATETKELLQKILDSYGMGVEILSIQMKKVDPPEKVINSFRDVQSARADKEREINQARAYRNDVLPRARGNAQKIIEEAEAYKVEVINKAEGDTKRFMEIYNQYKNNRSVMKTRLYIETLEEVYGNTDKILIDGNAVLPFLDLMKGGKEK